MSSTTHLNWAYPGPRLHWAMVYTISASLKCCPLYWVLTEVSIDFDLVWTISKITRRHDVGMLSFILWIHRFTAQTPSPSSTAGNYIQWLSKKLPATSCCCRWKNAFKIIILLGKWMRPVCRLANERPTSSPTPAASGSYKVAYGLGSVCDALFSACFI